jgi:hypothetical protein
MIEKNINRKYFNEKKLELFFEKLFSMSNTQALVNEQMFQDWLTYDIKQLIQILTRPSSLVSFSKMVVFLKLEDDPEIVELLVDVIIR